MKFLLSFILGLWAQVAAADPVVVFAAASLKEPIDALANELGDVVVSYGGSGALARQVLAGAPADVVLLANADWMAPLVAADTVRDVADFASNRLVVIGAVDAADLDLAQLPAALSGERLAIGAVASVPAGIYGRAALTHLGLWEAIAGQLAEVDSVRAALVLVARGEVPYAVTYATDAQASDAVRIVATFPETSHPPIRYTGGIVSDSPAARAFWQALQGAQGQVILADYGFLEPAR